MEHPLSVIKHGWKIPCKRGFNGEHIDKWEIWPAIFDQIVELS
jgi:hypothetical protein